MRSEPPKSKNITWHFGTVDRAARAKQKGHKGVTLWLTGLSGSGKSTLSRALEEAFVERGLHCYVLDGDNIRHHLNRDLGFTPEDRTENIRRVGEVARLMADAGLIVITAFISPYVADRERARSIQKSGDFLEVFLDVDVATCESRDPKGLYARARAGEIKNFTGISAPYEAPDAAEITVRTGQMTPQQCVETVLEYMESNGFLEG